MNHRSISATWKDYDSHLEEASQWLDSRYFPVRCPSLGEAIFAQVSQAVINEERCLHGHWCYQRSVISSLTCSDAYRGRYGRFVAAIGVSRGPESMAQGQSGYPICARWIAYTRDVHEAARGLYAPLFQVAAMSVS
jgi:hypothetical protein